MAPHSSTLAWKIPWMEEPGRLQSTGSWRVRHDWATSLSLSHIGEGNGNPLQCSWLENPRDGGAWWAAVYGVAQSQTRLKWLSNIYDQTNHRDLSIYRVVINFPQYFFFSLNCTILLLLIPIHPLSVNRYLSSSGLVLFANWYSLWCTTFPSWMSSEELRSIFSTRCTSCCFQQIHLRIFSVWFIKS